MRNLTICAVVVALLGSGQVLAEPADGPGGATPTDPVADAKASSTRSAQENFNGRIAALDAAEKSDAVTTEIGAPQLGSRTPRSSWRTRGSRKGRTPSSSSKPPLRRPPRARTSSLTERPLRAPLRSCLQRSNSPPATWMPALRFSRALSIGSRRRGRQRPKPRARPRIPMTPSRGRTRCMRRTVGSGSCNTV